MNNPATCTCDFPTLMRGGCQCGFQTPSADQFLGTYEQLTPKGKQTTLVITKNTFEYISSHSGKFTYDMIYTDGTYDLIGGGTGCKYKGIFKIEGDILTVCYNYNCTSSCRPPDFTQGSYTETFRRVK